MTRFFIFVHMKKNKFAIVFILIVLFTLFQELGFRRYLFIHQPFIAGCLPNFTAVLLFSFGYFAVKGPTSLMQLIRSVVFVVIGLLLYELVQIWMPDRVFDIADMGASILGGILAIAIIFLLQNWKTPEQK